ncbi:MAG TPA: hypothetical protein VHW09_26855 [Bryobacteraceae bacterium]|jgi:hypothetical protein|nr:hypothetical protein [Bryobacteraceae bacterium]
MTANNPPGLGFNSGWAFQIDGDTVPTPTQFKILQSASLDFKSTTKDLFGQNIFPVAVGRSQIKTEGKLKFADYQGRYIRDFVGAPNNSLMVAGQTLVALNEAGTVGTSPFTYQTTNHTTQVLDLGVVYATTGIPLTLVASSPTQGQYSVSAGTYTFNSADSGVSVYVSYTYTVSTAGDSVTISNTQAGAANSFQTVFGAGYNGLQTNFILNACIPTDLKIADFKIGDFSMPELGFSAVCNAAGVLGTISVPVTS